MTTNEIAQAAEDEFALYAYPGHLVRRLQQAAVAIFHEEMALHGTDLTPVQYAALVAIDAFPQIDQASLAGVIAYDRTTIGGVVDRLEAKKLIKRIVAEHDRRIRQLSLEPGGRELLGEIQAHVDTAQRRILGPLTEEERETFMVLLRKMVAAHNRSSRAPMRPFTGSSTRPR